ncbi:MAG: hypothetical protein HFG28_07705 [Eubacterium sp.]|nr:hypothetical protein [Eubacterium sp.]
MERKEYGSEFTETEQQKEVNFLYKTENVIEFLLGRTALEAIIQDAIAEHKIKKVLLPSYCCHTMIAPFLKHDFEVFFYDVFFSEEAGVLYDIDYSENFDLILIMQYFGFQVPGFEDMICRLKEEKKVVIEDATHSIHQNIPYCFLSDYVFVSYRKWMATPGGAVVIKRNGKLNQVGMIQNSLTGKKYVELRKEAVRKKICYLYEKDDTDKSYLQIFNEAEEMIETEYVGLAIDEDSRRRICYTDYNKLSNRRRENAGYLLERLREIRGMELPHKFLREGDVPLFVPVFLQNKMRDQLRKYLIKNAIYLPIHWPLSSLHHISVRAENIFKRELSLICDQRYNVEDMEVIASKIEEWMNKNV